MGLAEAPPPEHASSLKESLRSALPLGFDCKVRYVKTPSRQCDPLFSALPGHEAEKTRLASHFLTVSVDPSSLSTSTGKQSGRNVISFAVEVLVFTSRHLTTIFVSKVDSTSFIPRLRPSPIKTTVTAFLCWLADEERRKTPARKVVISLFARAQSQYLFPGSADDKGKHVLDDRQLIKWWARVLDPIIPHNTLDKDSNVEFQGYLTVPGYAKNELRSFMPPAALNATSTPRWKPGHPLLELAVTRGLPEHAPPRCLLPRFPDDPKARFMDDLDEEIGISQDSQVTESPSKRKSGRWNSIRDLDRFWEAMEFRQECSSGRVVGFLWLVIAPTTDDRAPPRTDIPGSSSGSQESQQISPSSLRTKDLRRKAISGKTKKKRKPLSGPIIPRQPRVKAQTSNPSISLGSSAKGSAGTDLAAMATKDGYDKAMQTLVNLDFSNLDIAARSTAKWIAGVASTCGLHGDFGFDIAGSAQVEGQAALQTSASGASAVNDLGGMIRKKRKANDSADTESRVIQKSVGAPGSADAPAVNILGGGMVRKKAKSTLAT